jgi:hypothetical protein
MENLYSLEKQIKEMQLSLQLKKKELESKKLEITKKKECPSDKFLNVKTKRCVKRKKCNNKKYDYDSNSNKCLFKMVNSPKAIKQKEDQGVKTTLFWDKEKKVKKYQGFIKDLKKDGQGISYNSDGIKEYEGQWKDNKRNGKGTSYFSTGSVYIHGAVEYEGMWKDNKKNGKGITYTYFESKIYQGEWKNDEENGKGTMYDYDSGIKIYQGEFKDGKKNGKGTSFSSESKIYQGEWKDDNRSGKGTSFYPSGKKEYEGEFKDGERDGKGTSYFNSGMKEYEGEFKDGKRNGKGTMYDNGSSNKIYQGEWKDGKRNGKGTSYDYATGKKDYVGEWKDGKLNGKGTSYYVTGKKDYVGEWLDGTENGKGTSYFWSGNKSYVGEFKDGRPNGKGTLYKENGQIVFKGDFKNGDKQCPSNKVFNQNNKCIKKKICGEKYLYDQTKNKCHKKRILLKSNQLGDVKWFKPTSDSDANNLIVPLKQDKVTAFGSEVIDNNWISEQYEYWKQLDDIDKLFLLVYTDYGDVLINNFLLKGVNGLDINAIIKKDYDDYFDDTINPFFPIFLKHPEIYTNINLGSEEIYTNITLGDENESEDLCKQIVDKKRPINERYKVFRRLFEKFFTKKLLEKTLEKYMNAFNENLNRIIDNSPKLKKEMLVARGSKTELSYDDKWTKRFTSTSISSKIAKGFSYGIIDIYILKPGTPCIPLFLSKYANELEILLGSGCCRYKIEKKETMKEVQGLAKKQFYHYGNLNMKYYEVSKKNSKAKAKAKAKAKQSKTKA